MQVYNTVPAMATFQNRGEKWRAIVRKAGAKPVARTFPTWSILPYVKPLRPYQWLKNMLIFIPMLVAHKFSLDIFHQSVIAFVAFSLIASSIYVINDLLDLAADRAHPRKCLRPFASGAIPVRQGTLLAAIVLLLGIACSATLGWPFTLIMLGYFASAAAYSLDLKRRTIIDICMLAALYSLRIVAGGTATEISLSVWLLAFSIFFFFSLAAMKRYAELVDSLAVGKIKLQGRAYEVDDLQLIGTIALASGYVSVLVLALYLDSSVVTTLYNTPSALWGICFILLYWITRMAMVTHRGEMHDDPIIYAINDPISRFCMLLILAFALAGALL